MMWRLARAVGQDHAVDFWESGRIWPALSINPDVVGTYAIADDDN